jgi:ABC-2 type transport system ATP-binding protein
VIQVEALRKVYRVPEKKPGLRGALASLFHREYKEVRAVDGISFTIRPGERVGFLGPNGAGKTTTLKMLSGLLVPTAGQVTVLGQVPQRRAPDLLRRITLVMGQKQQLLWDLPPRDTFELNRALYDIPQPQYRETLDELVELLALAPLLERPVRNLSLGERMKCELSAALLHRPEVLFLDEPTIGLDVVMQMQVRRFVAAWNDRHASTVLLTSHYMDDIAALCPRVIVIDGGRIRFDGELADLVRRHRPLRRVRVKPPAPPERPPHVEGLAQSGNEWVGDVAPEAVGEVVQRALAALPGAELTVEEPPLEEVFAEFFTSREPEAP